MSMVMKKLTIWSRHVVSQLQYQHSGRWGRVTASSRPDWTTEWGLMKKHFFLSFFCFVCLFVSHPFPSSKVVPAIPATSPWAPPMLPYSRVVSFWLYFLHKHTCMSMYAQIINNKHTHTPMSLFLLVVCIRLQDWLTTLHWATNKGAHFWKRLILLLAVISSL